MKYLGGGTVTRPITQHSQFRPLEERLILYEQLRRFLHRLVSCIVRKPYMDRGICDSLSCLAHACVVAYMIWWHKSIMRTWNFSVERERCLNFLQHLRRIVQQVFTGKICWAVGTSNTAHHPDPFPTSPLNNTICRRRLLCATKPPQHMHRRLPWLQNQSSRQLHNRKTKFTLQQANSAPQLLLFTKQHYRLYADGCQRLFMDRSFSSVFHY